MIRFCISAFCAVWLGFACAAQGFGTPHARVSLLSERTAVVPGEIIHAGIKLEMDEDWHVYWRNAGDAGFPPQLIVQDGSDFSGEAIGEFIWPIPELLPVVAGEIMDYGYNDEVVLPFALTVPDLASRSVTLDVVADYLICKEICVPETARVTLTMDVAAPQADEAAGAEIANWAARAPIALAGEARVDTSGETWQLSLRPETFEAAPEARFFPYGHEISHPATQPYETGSDGFSLFLTPDGDDPLEVPLEGLIVLTDASGARTGYTLSAVPGAALANTSGTLVSVKEQSGGDMSGVWWLVGLALLGGLVLNLMPCVLPVLTIKALGMVSSAASGEASEVRAHGVWYTVGVLMSFAALSGIIIAIRSTTGSANLGFQLQNGPTVAILALVMFAIGLWLMGYFELGTSIQNTGSGLASRGGAVGAFFTGVLAAVVGAPCVGPFLGAALGAVMTKSALAVVLVFLAMGLGLALPFLILSFVPGLHRLLPKPGQWMETLKQVFAFPMFLTAAWLLSVLAALAGGGAVGWTAAGAIGLVFAIWLMRRGGRGAVIAGCLALLAVFVGVILKTQTVAGPVSSNLAYSSDYKADVWSPERVQELLADGRPIFVDFTAAWCATCQVNKATTLKSVAVREAFETHNVAFLVADFTRKDPVIAEELRRHQRAGVPMYLWYREGDSTPQLLPELLSPTLVTDLVEK